MIISASRRTDIPAFYGEWFINRLRAGFVLVANPFNKKQVKRVSLTPESVEAIIFWTRNVRPLMPYLPEIDALGHLYSFQYTITGYPALLEQSTPGLNEALNSFCMLSDLLGPDRLVWRYDPILVSNVFGVEEHVQQFQKIAATLKGKTNRVTISFAEFYRKTQNNLKRARGLTCSDITKSPHDMKELTGSLAEIAGNYGMIIQSCAVSTDLGDMGILNGKCIDEKQLKLSFGIDYPAAKDTGQRNLCNCVKSVDIGQYNTCLHGCLYCYATHDTTRAVANYRKHNPTSPMLIGSGPESPAASTPRQYRLF